MFSDKKLVLTANKNIKKQGNTNKTALYDIIQKTNQYLTPAQINQTAYFNTLFYTLLSINTDKFKKKIHLNELTKSFELKKCNLKEKINIIKDLSTQLKNQDLRSKFLTNRPDLINYLKNIISKTDLPFEVDQVNKKWTRQHCDIYGLHYNRERKDYAIWANMFLKNNMSFYFSFFFNIIKKKTDLLKNKSNCLYLYKSTIMHFLGGNSDPKTNNKVLDFPTIFALNLRAKQHLFSKAWCNYGMRSFGKGNNELDFFISSYNAKWNNLENGNTGFFSLNNRMSRNYLIPLNANIFSFDLLTQLYENKLVGSATKKLYYGRLGFWNRIKNLFLSFKLKCEFGIYFKLLSIFMTSLLMTFKRNISVLLKMTTMLNKWIFSGVFLKWNFFKNLQTKECKRVLKKNLHTSAVWNVRLLPLYILNISKNWLLSTKKLKNSNKVVNYLEEYAQLAECAGYFIKKIEKRPSYKYYTPLPDLNNLKKIVKFTKSKRYGLKSCSVNGNSVSPYNLKQDLKKDRATEIYLNGTKTCHLDIGANESESMNEPKAPWKLPLLFKGSNPVIEKDVLEKSKIIKTLHQFQGNPKSNFNQSIWRAITLPPRPENCVRPVLNKDLMFNVITNWLNIQGKRDDWNYTLNCPQPKGVEVVANNKTWVDADTDKKTPFVTCSSVNLDKSASNCKSYWTLYNINTSTEYTKALAESKLFYDKSGDNISDNISDKTENSLNSFVSLNRIKINDASAFINSSHDQNNEEFDRIISDRSDYRSYGSPKVFAKILANRNRIKRRLTHQYNYSLFGLTKKVNLYVRKLQWEFLKVGKNGQNLRKIQSWKKRLKTLQVRCKKYKKYWEYLLNREDRTCNKILYRAERKARIQFKNTIINRLPKKLRYNQINIDPQKYLTKFCKLPSNFLEYQSMLHNFRYYYGNFVPGTNKCIPTKNQIISPRYKVTTRVPGPNLNIKKIIKYDIQKLLVTYKQKRLQSQVLLMKYRNGWECNHVNYEKADDFLYGTSNTIMVSSYKKKAYNLFKCIWATRKRKRPWLKWLAFRPGVRERKAKKRKSLYTSLLLISNYKNILRIKYKKFNARLKRIYPLVLLNLKSNFGFSIVSLLLLNNVVTSRNYSAHNLLNFYRQIKKYLKFFSRIFYLSKSKGKNSLFWKRHLIKKFNQKRSTKNFKKYILEINSQC